MDSLPSGYENARYYRLHPVTTGGIFGVHVDSRRRFQCLRGVDPVSVDVVERCLGCVLDALSLLGVRAPFVPPLLVPGAL